MRHKHKSQCKNCNQDFYPWYKNQPFCSRKCFFALRDISGDKNPKWRGGFYFQRGYKYIYKPKHPYATKIGYVREHRLVMEEKLGRYLKKDEVIHHLNCNPSDNRPKNLYLCQSTGTHFIEHHLEKRDKIGRFYKVKKSHS